MSLSVVSRKVNPTSPYLFGIVFVLLALFIGVAVQVAQDSSKASAVTTVPTRMNFQGRLADSTGNIKANGTYNMRLRLFTAASGGSAVWTEDRLVSAGQGVTLTNGLFALQLGSVTSLPASLFASGALYLEVELPTPGTATSASPSWTEGAMTPRNQMATSAYAYNSELLDGQDGDYYTNASNMSTGTLAVNRGGTGLGTITTNGIVYGNGTSAAGVTGAGTSGQILQANVSGVPGFVTVSGDALMAAGGAITVNRMASQDIRTLAPSNGTASKLQFGFTSWANNNTAPYADYLLMRGYADGSGGNDNLLLVRKDTFGLRQCQQTFGSAAAFSSCKDIMLQGDSVSAASISATGAITSNSTVQGTRLISTIATGTAPLTVTSTTKVTNLNVDLLDGLDSTAFLTSTTGVQLQVGTPGAAQTGNINVSGAVVASSFSGSGSGLTNLSASNLSSGTVNTARISGAYTGITGVGTLTDLTVIGAITQGGYLAVDGATDNMVVNGDFERNNSSGWTGVTNIVTGGYSGNYAARVVGAQTLEGVDYIPVDPTRDVLQLEAFMKKSVAGTTPGTMYFGYKAYDAAKAPISTAPCGSWCYFAASAHTIPTDSAWHKYSATTTGEGTVFPNFPVGTKYVRVLGLINYAGSGDSETLVDHISLKRINNGALFVGNNYNSTNLFDQYQQSQLYTTTGNVLTLATQSAADVNILNGGLQIGSTSVITAARVLQNVTANASIITGGTLASARLSGSYAGITGTGALAAGSIASGFGTIATTNTIQGSQLISTVATGTAPLTVTSTTKVANLNVDMIDGLDSSAFVIREAVNSEDITLRTQSGFHQSATASVAEGWPLDTNSWYHLMSSTHSNVSNYYAMQFSGSFYNSNDIFYRSTNGSGATAWNRLWHSGNDGASSGLDADTLDGLSSASFAASSGSGNYIQNTTGAQTANFNITGTGKVGDITIGTNGTEINSSSDLNLTGTGDVGVNAGAAFNVSAPDVTFNTAAMTINGSPAPGSWATSANPLPEARQFHRTVSVNGYMYVVGGKNSAGNAMATVVYSKINADGTIGTWQPAASLPEALEEFSVAVSGSTIYALGGNAWKEKVYYTNVRADGTLTAWRETTPMTGYGNWAAGALVMNGYIYNIGGWGGAGVVYSKIQSDGQLGKWNSTSSLPAARLGVSVVGANGYLYALGGGCCGAIVNTVYYAKQNADGTVGAWSTATNPLPTLIGAHASVVANGHVYVIGGRDNPATPYDTVYYAKLNNDGSPGTWYSAQNKLPQGIFAHGTVAFVNGRAYVAGGHNGTNLVTTVYSAQLGSTLKVGGNIDLVGIQGGTLADGASSTVDGSMGGSITAGNITAVGGLQVQQAANFRDSVYMGSGNVAGALSVGDTSSLTWTGRTAPAGVGGLVSVVYGNGMYVAVGYDTIRTSTDGITWTARTSPAANEWTSVTYGNGMFVAVAMLPSDDNVIMTSPDGITWTARNIVGSGMHEWNSVTYGNGLFVAVQQSGGGFYYTSPDGITWTSRTSTVYDYATSITYGNGLFVVVGDGVKTSTDGITWTARTSAYPTTVASMMAVTYGNGLFVAVAYQGQVMTSPDGITWTARTPAQANQWQSITYGNGLFVAVAQSGTERIMTSSDGISWKAQQAVEANTWKSVTYGGGRFIAVSWSGTTPIMTTDDISRPGFGSLQVAGTITATDSIVAAASSTSAFRIQAEGSSEILLNVDTINSKVLMGTNDASSSARLSINGRADSTPTTWTGRKSPDGGAWESVVYGNGIYVAVSQNSTPRIATSPDGITWTSRTVSAYNFLSVTYGNGLFVATISGGTQVVTSRDGITWTNSVGVSGVWNSVTYGNGLFVAVSSSTNYVQTSSDGVTWTARTAAQANAWRSVTYGNNQFVAVSNTGTNRVMTSLDGITWTARNASTANSWESVTYGNGLYVAVATGAASSPVMTSPDGITWSGRTAALNNWQSVTYGNGYFVAVASSGTDRVATSSDGFTWTGFSVPTSSWQGVTYGNGMFVAVSSSGFMTSGKTAINTDGSIQVAGEINTTGNITAVGVASSSLSVSGSNVSGYVATIANTAGGTSPDGLLIQLGVANASRGATNYFVGFADSTGAVAGKIQGGASAVAYTTTGADYAEYFKADPANIPQPGELVALDTDTPNGVELASGAAAVMGVVSTNPGFVGNGPLCNVGDEDCDANYAKMNALVSLVGQVPVKVTGEVKIGDMLGASDTPGVAQKVTSGSYVGYALTAAENGIAQVLIRPGVVNAATVVQGGDATFTSLVIDGQLEVQGKLIARDAEFSGTVTIDGHLVVKGVKPTVVVGQTLEGHSAITVDGTDNAGTISIESSANSAAGTIASVTFAKDMDGIHKVVASPTNEAASSIRTYIVKTSTGFKIMSKDPIIAGQQYTFDYIVIGAIGRE